MPIVRANKPIQLVRIEDVSDWDEVKTLAGDFLLPHDLDGLKQLLDGFVRSVYIYIEHDYVDADYRDTYSHFYSKKFAHYPDRAIRLLFFSDPIAADDWSEPAKFSNLHWLLRHQPEPRCLYLADPGRPQACECAS